MGNWSESDLTGVDLRALSAEEWLELKAEVRRRAHAERSQVLRGMMARLNGWVRGAGLRTRLEGRSYAGSQKRPLYFGGRA